MNASVFPFELVWSAVSLLALFWFCAVSLTFNAAYVLNVLDRAGPVPWCRVLATMAIGTLFVAGTYADALASKQFAMKDCLLLAFVAAHGWTADELLEHMVRSVSRQRGAAPGPTA